MFNLLPSEEKRESRLEYRRRLISASLIVFLLIMIGTFFLIMPSFISISSINSQIKNDLDILSKKPAVNDYKDLEIVIKSAKNIVDTLRRDIPPRFVVADLVEKIISHLPNGVLVEGVSWFSGSEGMRMIVNGTSANRELLRKFVSDLRSDKTFSEVTLPVSNFTKPEDVDFSITIQVAQ